jgi:hypothetical protein
MTQLNKVVSQYPQTTATSRKGQAHEAKKDIQAK